MNKRTFFFGVLIGTMVALFGTHAYFVYTLRQSEAEDRAAIQQIISYLSTSISKTQAPVSPSSVTK